MEGRASKDWIYADITQFTSMGIKETHKQRPILLTGVVAKICEKIIKNSEIPGNNNVITERQFGHREGISYITNFISLYSNNGYNVKEEIDVLTEHIWT